MRQGLRSEATEAVFCQLAKKPLHNETRPRERSDRGRFLPLGKKAYSYTGAYGLPLFNYSVRLSVYLSAVCVTFVVSTDCESCTSPISANPGSMEADEDGLTRGMCLVVRCLEVVAVAGLLWNSWCVLGGADFFGFSFFVIHFCSNARGMLQV